MVYQLHALPDPDLRGSMDRSAADSENRMEEAVFPEKEKRNCRRQSGETGEEKYRK